MWHTSAQIISNYVAGCVCVWRGASAPKFVVKVRWKIPSRNGKAGFAFCMILHSTPNTCTTFPAFVESTAALPIVSIHTLCRPAATESAERDGGAHVEPSGPSAPEGGGGLLPRLVGPVSSTHSLGLARNLGVGCALNFPLPCFKTSGNEPPFFTDFE